MKKMLGLSTVKKLCIRRRQFIAGLLAFIMLLSYIPFGNFVRVNAKSNILYGDVNRDTVVNEGDVTDLKKYLAEYDIDIDLVAADVNVDGAVDLKDLLLLEQYVAGLDVLLGEVVTITFHTNGGTAVNPIKLCKGATLSSVVRSMPKTSKDGAIFAGWFTASGSPFYAEDEVEEDINVYAAFHELEPQESLNITSFSLLNQQPNLSFTIVAKEAMSPTEVKSGLTLLAIDGSDPVELIVTADSDTQFTVKAANGFIAGAAYQLTLADSLYFKDKAQTIRTANFTIYKEEVDKLKFNDSIIYIRDTDSMWYTLDNFELPVPVLDAAMLSTDAADAVGGYFTYSGGEIKVGDILCIYEYIHPLERNYANENYSNDSVAYVKVTAVSGDKISFKSISDADAQKVIFIPDTIPFSVTEFPTGTNGSVNGADFDQDAWIYMGYTGRPEFNVGDFVVFYIGAFNDINEDTPVYFGEVTAIVDSVLYFKQTTAEAIKASQDLFLNNPVDGDELLEHVDTAKLKAQIEKQAIDSGFARAAAEYLANAAQETEGFKNMKLQNLSLRGENGQMLSASKLKSIGKEWELSDDITVKATIGKSSKYFKDGISLALTIEAEFAVDVGDEGELKIELTATFLEEVAVDVQINANADITWYLFIPVFNSLMFGASVDIKNYSGISVDVKVYTVEKEDEGLWEKLKGYNDTFKEKLEKAEELRKKIKEAKESIEQINAYIEDLQAIWSYLSSATNGELTEDSYDELVETLGGLNVTQEMMELLSLSTDDEIDAGVQDLMDRYAEMLENESDWITLVDKSIFDKDFHIHIFAIGIEVKFVIKANINLALGANMEYVVGKRYSFWFDIVKKTSGSSTMDLLDERFAFQFYVMGTIGLKMGIKAEIKAGIISTKIGSVGVSAEFGPYVKLWGYFIYEYSKMRPANTNTWNYDERMMGALYLEFGLYLTINFNAQILDGAISYNPTLLDKEFPLLTAGNRKNHFDFAFKIEDDEAVIVQDEDNNSNTGITMVLPEAYRTMKYMDLVEGTIVNEAVSFTNFIVTLSNRNFHFDDKTGIISVDVPENVQYMECDMTLTWKVSKLQFTSRDISITIPLVWTSLSTEELNQKFTATVKVGNPEDGFVTIWSKRVKKNALFDLPSEEEILELIGYENYNSGGENLKYLAIAGYGAQPTSNLTIYTDATYYFNVTLREYTLVVNGVMDKDGHLSTKEFKAKYSEKFDLTELLSSGASNAATGNFTAYLKTEATLDGSTTIGTGKDAREINQDITRVIDNQFAKQILSGVTYTAKYVDNSVTATFRFMGEGLNIADKTVKIKKGTVVPDIFSEELAKKFYIIKGISPVLGNIMVDTLFVITTEKSEAPYYTVTYHTNGGSEIEAKEVQQGSMMVAPEEPTKTGYRFVGWFTDPEFENAFDFTGAFMPGNDLDLYAKWVANKYSVTFDANEGTLPNGAQNPIDVTYDSQYGTLPTPVRTGYKFLGWFTERTGGVKISGTDTVSILSDITLYARWQAKATISASIISYQKGQKKTYNKQHQPFVFTTGSIASASFTVLYKRQGLDSEYKTQAVNAGTYDIKFVRAEDDNYKYFETVLTGVYVIEKAESRIITKPTGYSIYGNIIANRMVSDVDYVGDGQLMFAASPIKTSIVNVEWTDAETIYNLYDTGFSVAQFYLLVKLAEGENYKASEIVYSDAPIQMTNRPKSIIGGMSDLSYKIVIKTSNIKDAGTNSKIYIQLGNGTFQHLDASGNNFEQGDTDQFWLNVNSNNLYYTSYGTIPVTLKYEKSGLWAGWHCAWIRLDVYKNGKLLIQGNQYDINHWFGAEDYNQSTITETYNLTGFERRITQWGAPASHATPVTVTGKEERYTWSWNVSITDQYRSNYNPYEFLNAPVLSATFNNTKYNRFIYIAYNTLDVDLKGLYAACVADGVTNLNFQVTREFKAVSGNYSATSDTRKVVTTIPFTIAQSNNEKTVQSSAKRSAVSMFSINNGQLANIASSVRPGANGTFEVSYYLKENAGIWGTKFAVSYDKELVELLGYRLGDVFSEDEFTAPERYDNGRFVFLATRNTFDDTNATGKLVTLIFKTRDGQTFDDYPVSLVPTDSQSINAESGIVSIDVNANAPKIYVNGDTATIRSRDVVNISVSAGDSALGAVLVKKDNGEYIDITQSYENGYTVTENGTYTFKINTASGESATTSITYTKIDTGKPGVLVNSGSYAEGTWTRSEVTLTASTTGSNLGTTVLMVKKGDGEWEAYNGAITIADETGEISYSFKAVSQSGVESDVKTFVVKRDTTLPEGDIKAGTSSIKKILNTITFGLFFKDTQQITITATDSESGIAKIEYFVANEEADIESITDWTEYTEPFTINPNKQYVIYVRITDQAGNIIIFNSDGLVLDNIVPVVDGITDGATYCAPVTVTVSDDNLDKVTLNGAEVELTEGSFIVECAQGDQVIVVTDKAGNTVTLTIRVNDGHEWDDGVVIVAPADGQKGIMEYTCIHCGEKRTEEFDAPEMIERQDKWTQGSATGLAFRSSAALKDFINVTVDGIAVDTANYELTEGSTVVTLKAEYLATLSAGLHTISINSKTGSATAEFVVEGNAAEEPEIPRTGDTMNIWLYLLVITGGTITLYALSKKQEKIRL